MSKYANALKHQMDLNESHTKAINLLQGRLQALKSGPTEIPRTIDALALSMEAAGMIDLSETIKSLDKMYACTLEAKSSLDSTLESANKLHSVDLKQIHFGLNWIKIDAYDFLEDFMRDHGMEPEISYFKQLMSEIKVADTVESNTNEHEFADFGSGPDRESIQVLQELEEFVTSKQLPDVLQEEGPCNSGVQEMIERGIRAQQRIGTGMPQGDRIKRLILDRFKSRIGILEGKEQRLTGDEIVLRYAPNVVH